MFSLISDPVAVRGSPFAAIVSARLMAWLMASIRTHGADGWTARPGRRGFGSIGAVLPMPCQNASR